MGPRIKLPCCVERHPSCAAAEPHTQPCAGAAGVEGAKWPNFTFVDRKTVIYNGTYQHWGVLQPGNVLEPNNQVPPENCAGGNLTMGVRRADKAPVVFDGAAGWADRGCGEQYISMCKVTRERAACRSTSCCVGWEGCSGMPGPGSQLCRLSAHAPCTQLSAQRPPAASTSTLPSPAGPPSSCTASCPMPARPRRCAGPRAATWLASPLCRSRPRWSSITWPWCAPAAPFCAAACSQWALLMLMGVWLLQQHPGVRRAHLPGRTCSQGLLLPSPGASYYIGLQAQQWPNFTWIDFSPLPTYETYNHWASFMGEPDGGPDSLCAVANSSLAWDYPSAWGWADVACDQQFSYLCKMQGAATGAAQCGHRPILASMLSAPVELSTSCLLQPRAPTCTCPPTPATPTS